MNWLDWILLIAVVGTAVGLLIGMIRGRKTGCSGDCSNCSHCPHK